jgi:hypothetical protein
LAAHGSFAGVSISAETKKKGGADLVIDAAKKSPTVALLSHRETRQYHRRSRA